MTRIAKQTVIPVIDRDDPRIRPYVELRHVSTRRCGSDFIAEGRLVVERLSASRHRLISVLVQQGRESLVPDTLDTRVPVYSMPSVALSHLVGFKFHRGIMACGQRPPLRAIDSLRPDLISDNGDASDAQPCRSPVALALMGITCPENLGSMLRSAAAFGINQILIGPRTIDHLSRRVIRVSMASALKHRFYELNEPRSQLLRLRHEHGYRLVATTLGDNATTLDDWNPGHDRFVLMMGSEANGLDREIESLASDRVTIPMQDGTDSLNVSVAAAIFMHELARRRPKMIESRTRT